MNILGTICARGGSKGVKDKNIKGLAGKPLLAHTAEIFKKWGKADRVICSTDSEKIMKVAEEYGIESPFERPERLASDEAGKLPVIEHALKFCEKEDGIEYDVVVDLDVSAPLRKLSDVNNVLEIYKDNDVEVVYSVVESRRNPYFNMVEVGKDGYAHLVKELEEVPLCRQDTPKVYDLNASIYAYSRDFLLNPDKRIALDGKAKVYVMDDITAFDIDREIDFKFINFLLNEEEYKIE